MLSKNKLVEEKLKELVLTENEKDVSNYDWIEDYTDINFWKFLSLNHLQLDRFFTLLDVESGLNSGWEKFIEALGLNLWEDRRWCSQYHNGIGPTRAALAKLHDKKEHNKDLSLSCVLELLRKMERYDILLQIDWKFFIDKFKCPKSLFNTEKPLIFEFNQRFEACQLVQSENIGHINNEDVIKLNAKNKKSPSDICIMLLYASDAQSTVTEMVNEFKKGVNGRRIKVLLMGSPTIKSILTVDSSNMLHKWFNQVKYVVPILSPKYLKQVQNIQVPGEDREVTMYNRFIYKLTLDQYVSSGSRNNRCRPIVPCYFDTQMRNHSLVKGNGLFSVLWSCETARQMREFKAVLSTEPFLN